LLVWSCSEGDSDEEGAGKQGGAAGDDKPPDDEASDEEEPLKSRGGHKTGKALLDSTWTDGQQCYLADCHHTQKTLAGWAAADAAARKKILLEYYLSNELGANPMDVRAGSSADCLDKKWKQLKRKYQIIKSTMRTSGEANLLNTRGNLTAFVFERLKSVLGPDDEEVDLTINAAMAMRNDARKAGKALDQTELLKEVQAADELYKSGFYNSEELKQAHKLLKAKYNSSGDGSGGGGGSGGGASGSYKKAKKGAK